MNANPVSVILMCSITSVIAGLAYGSYRRFDNSFDPSAIFSMIGIVGLFLTLKSDKFFLFVISLTLVVMYPLSAGLKLSQVLYGFRTKIEIDSSAAAPDKNEELDSSSHSV